MNIELNLTNLILEKPLKNENVILWKKNEKLKQILKENCGYTRL